MDAEPPQEPETAPNVQSDPYKALPEPYPDDGTMPVYLDEDGFSEFLHMPLPAVRLYLLEQGRRTGVTACNGSHREETHGVDHYWVTYVREPFPHVLVRCARGRNERSFAEAKVNDSLSQINSVKSQIKAFEEAKKAQLESDPYGEKGLDAHTVRQCAELDSRIAPLKERLEALEKTMLAARKVPMPLFYAWKVRL